MDFDSLALDCSFKPLSKFQRIYRFKYLLFMSGYVEIINIPLTKLIKGKAIMNLTNNST